MGILDMFGLSASGASDVIRRHQRKGLVVSPFSVLIRIIALATALHFAWTEDVSTGVKVGLPVAAVTLGPLYWFVYFGIRRDMFPPAAGAMAV